MAKKTEIEWIKLDVDMFSNPKIKKIRRLPEGNNILLIWVMLLTMAGKCNASGMIFITQTITYTIEDLADELSFTVDTVKLALQALETMGMITTSDGLEITNWHKHQSGDKLDEIREQNRIRQQNFREKQKQLQIENGCNVTNNVTNNVTPLISYSYSNNINNINNNNTNNIDKNIYIVEIVNYLNQVCGTSYKPSSKTTKEHINARLNEGFTVEDFKLVIDKKFAEWGSDYKMAQYLRPQTLFSTKFESYLNQKGGKNVRSGMARGFTEDAIHSRGNTEEELAAYNGESFDDD